MNYKKKNIKIVDIIEKHDIKALEKWLQTGDPNTIIGYGEIKKSLLDHVIHEIDEPVIIEMVKILLEKGADVNLSSDPNDTPVFSAVKEGKAEIVKILLDAGANFDLRDNQGDTPLTVAVLENHIETLEILLSNSTKEVINKWGTHWAATPLGIAFAYLNIPMVELLLKHGADPYIADGDMFETISHIPKATDSKTIDLIFDLIEKHGYKRPDRKS